MKQEILFVLLPDFADWEGVYIATSLNYEFEPGSENKYIVKTMSITKEPVVSSGGFTVLPDYDIHDIPSDYAGLVLIGGTRWFSPEAELLVPLVKETIENKKLVAGICNGSVFLGKHGFLNTVNHTSNGLEYIKTYAGTNYTGESLYINEGAARAGNIVTANGLCPLEFCREILYALDAFSPSIIEQSYRMHKTGTWEA